MATKTIRSHRTPISIAFTLATADDVDGTTDNTQAAVITGAARGIVVQHNNGTLGTAGIDIIEYSHDGGLNWLAATDLIPVTANDFTGTVLAGGALNAAGVEPVNVGIWTCGPFEGPTAVRCARKTTTTAGTTWITGAPTVTFIAIGGSHAGGALPALA